MEQFTSLNRLVIKITSVSLSIKIKLTPELKTLPQSSSSQDWDIMLNSQVFGRFASVRFDEVVQLENECDCS
jgi:hypothetical protein